MKLNCKSAFIKILAVAVVMVAAAPKSGFAIPGNCGIPYAQQDRSALRSLLVNDIRMMAILSRLTALATLSEFGTFSAPQRMALNGEFQALKMEIDFQGSSVPVPGLRPRTNNWIRRILDTSFLGLTGTDILTPTSAGAARYAASAAENQFYLCY